MSEKKGPSFFALVQSALSAMVGVQSHKKYELDFNETNPLPFIAAGVIMVALFLIAVFTIVSLVL